MLPFATWLCPVLKQSSFCQTQSSLCWIAMACLYAEFIPKTSCAKQQGTFYTQFCLCLTAMANLYTFFPTCSHICVLSLHNLFLDSFLCCTVITGFTQSFLCFTSMSCLSKKTLPSSNLNPFRKFYRNLKFYSLGSFMLVM